MLLSGSAKRDKVFLTTKISDYKGLRNRMYKDIFTGLPGEKQTAIMARVKALRQDRAMDKPGYHFDYYPGQHRAYNGAYLSVAMMQDYRHQVEGSKTFRTTIFESIEGSLRRVGTDHFDLLMCPHGADAPEEVNNDEMFEALETLRRQGKVGHFGVTTHNDPAGIIRAASKTGKYDVVMCAYNILNGGYLEDTIRMAVADDMGIIAMKTAHAVATHHKQLQPIPEWRVQKIHRIIPGEMKAPVKAYLWALQNPHVTAVISNLWDEPYIRENLSVAGKKVDLQPG
jgi:aryl-alcohol dehydrogenase-like predicted oxidoreductase